MREIPHAANEMVSRNRIIHAMWGELDHHEQQEWNNRAQY